MSSKITRYQERVLKLFSGKMQGFYLVGGTALSLYYFHHRDSFDLDFFTQSFNRIEINRIIKELSQQLGKKIELTAEQNKENFLKIAVFMVHFNKSDSLKIDFVQDSHKFLKPLKIINGLSILSLEDIYLRKIYAVAGVVETTDIIGAKMMIGGRQEAKDFFDLYCLSNIFMRLSKFAEKYCDAVDKEALIRWFRTYDRIQIKTGLLELITHKGLDYKLMENHFKKQIDKLLEQEVGL